MVLSDHFAKIRLPAASKNSADKSGEREPKQ